MEKIVYRRKKAGRNPLDGAGPCERVTITLLRDDYDFVKEKGGGNFSGAIREIIEEARQARLLLRTEA